MSFKDCKLTATNWADKNSFKIVSVDENERKIVFTHCTIDVASFYVIFPKDDQSNDWNIWSDSDAVVAYMQDIIDRPCDQNSLEDILQRVQKALTPLIGTACNYKEDSDASSCMGDSCSDDMDDMDHDIGDYYNEEDEDALMDTASKLPPEEESAADKFFTGDGSPGAVQRLVKDMKALNQSNGKFGVVGIPREDNLFIWDVKLTDFDPKTPLGKDLKEFARKYKREPVVYMELKFPKTYPMEPPFARVIRPRFKFLTGHITIGGSICMEMLTRSGWRPINDIESILVQIRSEVMSDPNTRLDSNPDNAYGEQEAKQAFERTVMRYGWNK